MAGNHWKLIDDAQDFHAGSFELGREDVAGAPESFAVRMRTLQGGLRHGVDVIEVHNGRFKFTVVPTRGLGIWKGWLGDLEVGWQSPVNGPVHPSLVALNEPSGLGWLDGFDELFVRCGLESNGAPDFDENGRLSKPLHGRIANKPARSASVEVDGDEIIIRGVVQESRFHFTKVRLHAVIKTKFNEAGFRVHDEVENYSASAAEIQMLYHVNFGHPLLGAGAEAVVPIDTLVPRNDWAATGVGHWSTYTEPTAGMEERVYFFTLLGDASGNSHALLKSGGGKQGASLDFNVKQLPCFSLWKNETALGDGYVTGIEPGTNYPNPRSFEGEHGRFVTIQPGERYTMDIGLNVHSSADEVAAVENRIDELQKQKKPTIHEKPQADWCA
ncbi:MAG: aldose 1-epimerase family protein [Planctomycetales bacterium]|nr:aldose 1-epimerase family protein [Planctomycetales bacterium]